MGGVEKVSQDNYPHLVIRSRKHSKRKKNLIGAVFHIYIKVLISITSHNMNIWLEVQDSLPTYEMTKEKSVHMQILIHTCTHLRIHTPTYAILHVHGKFCFFAFGHRLPALLYRSTGQTKKWNCKTMRLKANCISWQKRSLYLLVDQVQRGVR